MKRPFGCLPSGEQAWLYTISCGSMTAQITDYGATLVRLYVPDASGKLDDVVLGFDDCNGYRTSPTYFGATVGRNANRIGGASFAIGDRRYKLPANENGNTLHGGPESYAFRLWKVEKWEESLLEFSLHSPDGDQGYPGNADIRLVYRLEPGGVLHLTYDAISDKDTVFNLTNHSFFNLAGHHRPELAKHQTLILPARHFTPVDAQNIPTGQLCNVEGTPMDFRQEKPICQDVDAPYEALRSGGYDHNFEVFTDPCAILHDPTSGRTMSVSTDLPGLQFYSGNYLVGDLGKDGISYCHRGGVALETQYYPNAVNNPQWKQPFVNAGERWHSETKYIFK